MQMVRIFRKRMNCDKKVETQLNDYLMNYREYSVVRTEYHRDGGSSCGETLVATMELNESKGNDAVDVVRCKDCKYCHLQNCEPHDIYLCHQRWNFTEETDPDGFCHRGKRKGCDEK